MKKEQTGKILKITIIMVFFLSLIFVIWQFFFSTSGTYALIYQDNVLLHKINLAETSEPSEFTIEYTSDGVIGYNTIRVENGSIGIIDADCPDKVCQHMGMTSSTNFPITCLPHKLVIQIVEDSENTADEPDIISH